VTDALLVGGTGVSAFVGVDGGTAQALGLQLSDAQFGLALLTARSDATRSWTSFQATAGSVSFVGLDGLKATASGITVAINQADKAGDRVVDYALTAAEDDGDARNTLLSVPTSATTTLTLTMDGAEGEIIKAAGTLDIDLFGFFSVQGQFAVESRSQQVTLSDGSVIKEADLVTIGGSDVQAFAGVRAGEADAIGLSLGDVDFGLALISDPKDENRNFTSLQARAGSAAVVGIDSLTLKVQELLVNINDGIAVDAQQAFDTKTNTRMKLLVPASLVGKLTLSDGTDDADVELTSSSARWKASRSKG
jgi:hypothetical protein